MNEAALIEADEIRDEKWNMPPSLTALISEVGVQIVH